MAALGCSKHTVAPLPPVDPGPTRNTPVGVVQRVAWDWSHRDATHYATLLTGDFQYAYGVGDSAGGASLSGTHWTRNVERLCIARMFDAAAAPPVVSSLTLDVDRQNIALPDPRPGKDPRWHRTVRSHIDLNIEMDRDGTGISAWAVTGNALFFLVRGDSATLSRNQQWEGFTQDSTQWWIDRWEDESLAEGGLGFRPMPSHSLTLTSLKSLFLPLPGAPR